MNRSSYGTLERPYCIPTPERGNDVVDLCDVIATRDQYLSTLAIPHNYWHWNIASALANLHNRVLNASFPRSSVGMQTQTLRRR